MAASTGANLGGEIQDAEIAADAVNAGQPVPMSAEGYALVPGSRLSVLFNPGPIQNLLMENLEPRDILSIMSADPYARRKLVPQVGGRPGEQVGRYVFPRGPDIHVEGFCDTEYFTPDDGWDIYGDLGDEKLKGLDGNPANANAHLLRRLDLRLGPNLVNYDPRIHNIERPPWYDASEWFKCRRDDHFDYESAHCNICNDFTWGKMTVHWTPRYKIVCGLCHQQATRQWPWGYAPQQFSTPDVSAFPCCECTEDMRQQTCYPCAERVLNNRLQAHNDLDRWPESEDIDDITADLNPHRSETQFERYNLRPIRNRPHEPKWHICPCGREIDPIKSPNLYPPDVRFGHEPDGELDYEEMGQGLWTLFCYDCNNIWVPKTRIGPVNRGVNQELDRPMFKQALGLGGGVAKKTHWRRQPRVDLDEIVRIGRRRRR